MTINMALIGCGGMGLRHVYGMIQLKKHFDTFNLVALCDQNKSAAEHVSAIAEKELGIRPQIFTEFDDLLASNASVDAVDITVDTGSHHKIAIEALASGAHVIVEKPMGITIKACNNMADASDKNRKVLAVAENYRRDPLCRLAKTLLNKKVIGDSRVALDISIGGGDALMHNTAWRVIKSRGGGFLLEQGVHNADLLLYYLGEAQNVFAETALLESEVRRTPVPESLAQFYEHRSDDIFPNAEIVSSDADDTGVAVIKFESGAICQMTMSRTSPSKPTELSTIHGSLGTMIMPNPRQGIGPVIQLAENVTIEGDELLKLVPDMELDECTAAYFGGTNPIASYDIPFEEVDSALVAIELQDFAESIQSGDNPEVDQNMGMQAVALIYGILESGYSGIPVSIKDIVAGSVSGYQQSIDLELGI